MTRTEKQHTQEQPWEKKYRAPWPVEVKAILDKGCRPLPLQMLLRVAVDPDCLKNPEVEALKDSLKKAANHLEAGAELLRQLAENPLWVATADLDASENKNKNVVQSLWGKARALLSFADELNLYRSDIAEHWSVRRFNALVPLAVYCKVSSQDTVTVREIADLLNWAEHPKGVKRMQTPQDVLKGLERRREAGNSFRATLMLGFENTKNLIFGDLIFDGDPGSLKQMTDAQNRSAVLVGVINYDAVLGSFTIHTPSLERANEQIVSFVSSLAQLLKKRG